ncbi:DUF2092 domain-containing protein [Flavobacteriaceae bacterium F89]|uniref:DUF2092 domain-containing protein n=1 Tax=Cerina litoralis TaxID=2874477 RepID=A0AAE3JSG4_9FLAO|nr:DUF2092 domain-containing protein [Cerina litoralis]MCG2460517.1 DUF2092 domain-containing protein [Cerina litoralis]
MKRLLLIVTVVAPVFMEAQAVQKDSSSALYLFDRMASVIGELESCSYTLHRSEDVLVNAYGPEKHFATDKVQLVGPNKMSVQTHGDRGHIGFWYNGKYLARYNYNENNYTIVEAPNNIIDMIDTIHHDYGVDFPAADFLNPTFTDDLVAQFDNIVLLGKRKIEGQDCFYIMATNKNVNIQFWINDGAITLPKKFLITYKNKDNRQFEATFSDWILNPVIPNTVFDFLPPPSSREVAILPQS